MLDFFLIFLVCCHVSIIVELSIQYGMIHKNNEPPTIYTLFDFVSLNKSVKNTFSVIAKLACSSLNENTLLSLEIVRSHVRFGTDLVLLVNHPFYLLK